jgi:hypothetical protein
VKVAEQAGMAGVESVLDFCWHFFLYLLVAVIFSGFSGSYWFGEYPATGATILVLISVIPVVLSSKNALQQTVRLFVPFFLFYLFYANTSGAGTPIERLQERLGIAHFILVFLGAVSSIYLTAGNTRDEDKGKSKHEPEPVGPEVNLDEPGVSAFDRIVGQAHVIAPLHEIAKIARSGIRVGKENAPHAVLLFLGPTGVGKTEAAIALAEEVFGSKNALVRFDMGQFTDSHQASRFYGPPPGYVGYEEGGQLTRAVLRKPHCVVLLDEVEKAHPQIWDAFLPVFDEGYIVDGSTNQRVNMTNTVIVLTSNLLASEPGLHHKSSVDIKEAVQATGAFRPELLGRINEILVFQPLSEQSVAEILQRRLDAALWSLSSQGISVTVSPGEMEEMVQEIRAAKFGVRQIDDVVRKYLRAKITT